jgi:hypothetical protein
MSAKRKHRTPNEYLKYLKGELSGEERYTFERDLEADPFEMDAMEGMEQIPVGELEEDLLSIHADMRKRLKRRRRRTFYYAAASVASLLIVGTVFLNIYNINPKSAQEAIPNDETFLHEDVTEQANVPVQEEKSTDRIILKEEKDMAMEQATVPVKAQIQEETPVLEIIQDRENAQNQDEIIVHEEMAMRAAKVVSDEVISGVVEAPIPEAPVPVSKADELVVMEAQPKRSQKKARTQEAPSAYTTGQVSGIVVSSEDMEPLPGASITVKGSDSGMVADMEGRFSLVTDQQAQTTVIASYVGMETDEYQLAGGTENRVVMQPDMATLNEVVVIGYDADKETYATGAVQTVKLDKEESKYSGAEPEEGLEAYKIYIEEQIRFPAGDTISKREVVVLKFNVALDGSISQITTLRSPGDPFTEEAIRLLNEGPSWNPAKNESGATDDVVRMRIVFKR